MKRLNKFLTNAIAILTGMICSSLWITHSDYWKVYLPIVLLCISFKMIIEK